MVTWRLVRETLPEVPIDIGGHIVNDDEVTQELIERMREACPTESFNVWEPSFERSGRPHPAGLSDWLRVCECEGTGVTFVKRDGLEYYAKMPGVGLKEDGVVHAPLVDATFDKRALGFKVPELSAGLIVPDSNLMLHNVGLNPTRTALLDALVPMGILNPVFAARFRSVAGFRNLLVHGYLEIDLVRLHQALNEHLEDFIEFAACIRSAVAKPPSAHSRA